MDDVRTIRLDIRDIRTIREVLGSEADALWDLYCSGDVERQLSDDLNDIIDRIDEQIEAP